jgi:hypothetical protein
MARPAPGWRSGAELVAGDSARFASVGGWIPHDKSGMVPQLLVLSATPISRTLALSVFGDLEPLTMNRGAPGRQPVVPFGPVDLAHGEAEKMPAAGLGMKLSEHTRLRHATQSRWSSRALIVEEAK